MMKTIVEDKLHKAKLEVNVNLEKTGSDRDVIEMWIRDELVHIYGFDLLPEQYEVPEMEKLIQEAKKFEARA